MSDDKTTVAGPQKGHEYFELEYNSINDNIRYLADVRFKLLAFLPSVGGAGVFVLSTLGLQPGSADPGRDVERLATVLLVSMLGFLATFGITLYDQRNSELYNALIDRAKALEEAFGVPRAVGSSNAKAPYGGQFSERPGRNRRLVVKAGHSLALALIYGPLLGAWLFPLAFSTLLLLGVGRKPSSLLAADLALVGVLAFTVSLNLLDMLDFRRKQCAEKEDRDKAAANASTN